MANEFYEHSTYPAAGSFGTSSGLRAEFELVEDAFDKLPTLVGNAGKFVRVNAAATGLEAANDPNIGTATGTSLAVTGALTSSGGLIGYATGAGGTVTQLTDKSTAVTLNKLSGQITTHNASLASAAIVRFVVNNSLVSSTDVPMLAIQNSVTASAYRVWVESMANGLFRIAVENRSPSAQTDAVVINFVIFKAVAA